MLIDGGEVGRWRDILATGDDTLLLEMVEGSVHVRSLQVIEQRFHQVFVFLA